MPLPLPSSSSSSSSTASFSSALLPSAAPRPDPPDRRGRPSLVLAAQAIGRGSLASRPRLAASPHMGPHPAVVATSTTVLGASLFLLGPGPHPVCFWTPSLLSYSCPSIAVPSLMLCLLLYRACSSLCLHLHLACSSSLTLPCLLLAVPPPSPRLPLVMPHSSMSPSGHASPPSPSPSTIQLPTPHPRPWPPPRRLRGHGASVRHQHQNSM